ncbi:MAG: NYN domain-containing protein [Lachnospiraceae bacterium]
MKHLVVGILAHVDAGKTTLSEAMLYKSGTIRNAGRVDKGDAFLDTFELEKQRGITIFSKQAVLPLDTMSMTLLDTPGHVDFSAEMERTLQVLDYAILLISGADGVQGHTRTLWNLLKKYEVPTFLFFNKMDQPGTDKKALLQECKEKLSDGMVDFSEIFGDEFIENVAVCDDRLLEQFLEGNLKPDSEELTESIRDLVCGRKLFPCLFGAALHMQGVEALLQCIEKYTRLPEYPAEFGAKVFKISRDEQGNRLTFCKITGGKLKVKDLLEDEDWKEKVNQIRIYSGAKYQTAGSADAGQICTLTGLSHTYPGEGLGSDSSGYTPVLEPVMTYQMILPDDVDAAVMLPKVRQLEEEEPQLHVVWEEKLKEIHVQIMGEVQLEILKSMILQRFGVEVHFGCGHIVYKETIQDIVEGVGHFEPLRHYAEVHLLLEPLEPGSGIQVAASCSEDLLDRNWQRLILTHLEEKEHRGVLTGSAITDIKMTLVSGKAHLKHTEGGDFRQATYRAVRQGLMQAKSVLLEPFYSFSLEIPEQMLGRGMTDVERMHGTFEPPMIEGGVAVLKGKAPVSCMQSYQNEVTAYTRGQGRLTLVLAGYGPCHNTEEVLAEKQYDPELDMRNPAGSVFCAHGAGFVVPWYQVPEYMHLESIEDFSGEVRAVQQRIPEQKEPGSIGTDEIDAILSKTFYANSQSKVGTRKWSSYSRNSGNYGNTGNTGRDAAGTESRTYSYGRDSSNSGKECSTKEYLLVDGYNIIFAWQDLKELAEINIDSARGKLLDVLCNYQGIKKCEVIAVFDAYRVAGHATEISDYHNIHVVFTKEAETADQYIEKFAHENGKKYKVTVATSDGLEQIIIRGQGCFLLSAREFQKEIAHANQVLRTDYLEKQKSNKQYMMDDLNESTKEQIADYLQKYDG